MCEKMCRKALKLTAGFQLLNRQIIIYKYVKRNISTSTSIPAASSFCNGSHFLKNYEKGLMEKRDYLHPHLFSASSSSSTICIHRYFSSKEKSESLTFNQLGQELEKSDTILIDVREKSELMTDGKIPNSNNIPLGELDSALKMNEDDFMQKYGFEKPSQNKAVITHCKKGVRAKNAADILCKSGFKNVRTYPGILDWIENGGQIIK